MKRREFMESGARFGAAFAGTALAELAMPGAADAMATSGGIDIMEGLDIIERGKAKNKRPEIRPEITGNPRAVFIIETNVEANRDQRGFFHNARGQLFEAGKALVPKLFTAGTTNGGSTAVCPNFCTVEDIVASPVSGVMTSPDFVAGFIEGLRALGNTNSLVCTRGGSAPIHRKTGIYDAFDPYNIDFIEAKYRMFTDYDQKKELNWHRVENPVVWKNIPTTRPLGDPDCFLVSMPTLKSHNLGITTLAVKNHQGMIPVGHGYFCTQWAALEYMCRDTYSIDFERDFVKNYYENVEAGFLKHRAAGFKYWDYEQAYPVYEKKGGWEAFKKIKNDPEKVVEFTRDMPENLMWDEIWCQRALDASSAIQPNLNVIEGIIGRDGSGFRIGHDELCNVIVVGISPYEVDAVATYLMGHNPNEVYYTRIAKERGLGECDHHKIAVYHWGREGFEPVRDITRLKRHPLGVTLHERKNDVERLFF